MEFGFRSSIVHSMDIIPSLIYQLWHTRMCHGKPFSALLYKLVEILSLSSLHYSARHKTTLTSSSESTLSDSPFLRCFTTFPWIN